jgi:hypoxanthine phosphoribosyltransferase
MTAPGDIEREFFTWQEFGESAHELGATIVESGYIPDLILCIARGGLTVGGALAYAMGIKNCFAISVEYYTGVNQRLDLPVILAPELRTEDLTGLKVLLVDDVADTGNTLDLVMKTCAPQVKEIRSAVLYHKSHSIVEPNYAWKKTDDWIVFPWSARAGILESTRDA